jgi:hypothetical protein
MRLSRKALASEVATHCGSDRRTFARCSSAAIVTRRGGTLSFWLRLDPQKDLAPGFTDPIQLTDKAYNDSAVWVDFTKDDVPRYFRCARFRRLASTKVSNKTVDALILGSETAGIHQLPPDRHGVAAKRQSQLNHFAVRFAGAGRGTATRLRRGLVPLHPPTPRQSRWSPSPDWPVLSVPVDHVVVAGPPPASFR